MMNLLWCLLQQAHATPMQLRIALDDRADANFVNPVLVVGEKQSALLDDGTSPGDVPGDNIWVTSIEIERSETVSLSILDGSPLSSAGEITVAVPAADQATIQLKRSAGAIVLDINAPLMPDQGAQRGQVVVAQAEMFLPSKVHRDPSLTTLVLQLDNRSAAPLERPEVRHSGTSCPLLDDGSSVEDVAGDGIYIAFCSVPKGKTIEVEIVDGQQLAKITAFLTNGKGSLVSIKRSQEGFSAVSDLDDLITLPTQSSGAFSSTVIQASSVLPSIQPTSAENLMVVVQMDNRGQPLLENPYLQIGQQECPFVDDGRYLEDLVGDGIYTAICESPRNKTVIAEVQSGDTRLGELQIQTSESEGALVTIARDRSRVKAINDVDVNRSRPKPLIGVATERSESSKRELEFSMLNTFGSALREPELQLGEKSYLLSETENTQMWNVTVPVTSKRWQKFSMRIGGQLYREGWIFLTPSGASRIGAKWTQDGLEFTDDPESDAQPFAVSAVAKIDADETRPRELRLTVEKGDNASDKIVLVDLLTREGTKIETSKLVSYAIPHTADHPMLYEVKDKNQQLVGRFSVLLPKNAGSVSLKLSKETISSVDEAIRSGIEAMVMKASPGGLIAAPNSDQIILKVLLDDRLIKRLKKPLLMVNEEDVEDVLLSDDGTGIDSESGDYIYSVQTLIARAEFTQIAIRDEGRPVGQLTIFLPSTAEAVVRLRSTESGVRLMTEPVGTGETSGPETGGGSGISETVAHVLWVGIGLFALGFSQRRKQLQRLANRIEALENRASAPAGLSTTEPSAAAEGTSKEALDE